MAGTRDSRANMTAGVAALEKARIPVTFFPLPGARHGEMGEDPEATFRRVFGWLDGNTR
jgi:hypothetical protein